MIARIFFVVNRSWSGLITLSELRKSNLLATIRILEEEEDINQITDFFSYEHFYVIYCKFWELDKDHDLFIDREDLSRHNDHGKTPSIYAILISNVICRILEELRSPLRLRTSKYCLRLCEFIISVFYQHFPFLIMINRRSFNFKSLQMMISLSTCFCYID